MSDYEFRPFLMPIRGRREWASYTEQEVPHYEGNPMIEALPPIWSEDKVIKLLQGDIKHAEDYRRRRAEVRYHMVYHLIHLFIPLPQPLLIEQSISRAIREGYYARNPYLDKRYWRNDRNTTGRAIQYVAVLDVAAPSAMLHNGTVDSGEQDEPQELDPLAKTTGFAVIGLSGVGKSTTIDRNLLLYPQIIDHLRYHNDPFPFTQLVWLKLECPHDGSLKGLCLDFFQSIDCLLNTNYYETFADNGNASVPKMLPSIKKVARAHCLGLLVLDELQNLSSAKSGGAELMLNYLVSLENSGLPLLMIGTPKAMRLFNKAFSQARRAAGQGDFVWDRMKNDGVWRIFLRKLWEYQYTQKDSPLTDELSNCLYDVTLGITDVAVKIYILAQMRAIASGVEQITENIIRAVADDSLVLAKRGLDAIRNGDYTAPEIDDICLDLERHLREVSSQTNFRSIDVDEVDMGMFEEESSEIVVPKAAEHALEQNRQEREVPPTATEKKNPSQERKVIKDGLLDVIARGRKKKLDPYESLKAAGYICQADEFLDLEPLG